MTWLKINSIYSPTNIDTNINLITMINILRGREGEGRRKKYKEVLNYYHRKSIMSRNSSIEI